MAKRVGLMGFGGMGKPIMMNLARKYETRLWIHENRKPAEEVLALGAKEVRTPKELAEQTDVAVICITGGMHVEDSIIGPQGLVAGAKPGWTLIDCSTRHPDAAKEIAQALAAKGARMLDGPVSGGIPRARVAQLSTMVGGDPKVLEECRDVLETYASQIFHIGPEVGMGNAMKLVNNYMTTVNMVTAVEAMVLGVKAGLNPKTIWEVVKVSTGNSSSFERRAPYMFNRKFELEGRLRNGYKDIESIRVWANSLGVPAFMASVAQQIQQLAITAGLGDMDSAALVIPYERIVGVEVKA